MQSACWWTPPGDIAADHIAGEIQCTQALHEGHAWLNAAADTKRKRRRANSMQITSAANADASADIGSGFMQPEKT